MGVSPPPLRWRLMENFRLLSIRTQHVSKCKLLIRSKINVASQAQTNQPNTISSLIDVYHHSRRSLPVEIIIHGFPRHGPTWPLRRLLLGPSAKYVQRYHHAPLSQLLLLCRTTTLLAISPLPSTMWRFLRFLRLTPPPNETQSMTSDNALAISGPFDTLPVELIQHVAHFLPTSTAAAFALSNHYLCEVIGCQYWTDLHHPTEVKEREIFLQLLDRDLTYHLFCHRCRRLHLPTPAGIGEWTDARLIHRLKQRRCFQEDFSAKTANYLSTTFRFEHLQMTMKLHRLGLDFQTYLRSLARVENNCTRRIRDFRTFEARVVSNEMIIRSQHWLFLAPGPPGQGVKLGPGVFPCPEVCAHLNCGPYYPDDNILAAFLKCRISHLNKNEDPCTYCRGLKQCWYCPTEYQIDVKVFDGRGPALVVTKWMDLGAGREPSDPKWRSHLLDKNYRPVLVPVPFFIGTISRAFEGREGVEFDEVMTLEVQRLLANC
jgi:hypothetical protein